MSYAYSDSASDLPMLEAVGHPVAVNPDGALARVAHDHGWPIVIFRRRTRQRRAPHDRPRRRRRDGRRRLRRRRRRRGKGPRAAPGGADSLAGVGRFYITTPIYYVNDAPHIGHAYTTVIADAAGPLAPADRRRRLLPDRHRRARPQGAAGRRGPRRVAPGVGRPDRRALPGRVEAPRHHQRRLHPHHRAPPLPRRRAAAAGLLRQRRHRARHVRGPLLRVVRGVLHRGRAGRRQLPHPRPPRRARQRGELLLQALPVRAAAARLVRAAPRLRRARDEAQRGPRLHPLGAAGLLDQPHVAQRGASRCRGTAATSPTSGSTPSPTTSPPSATAPTPSASPGGGRARTSSARTSCASTPCTGRRCCCRPASPRPSTSTCTASCWSAARR